MGLPVDSLISKARVSGKYLWVLNFFLPHIIPFNRPHKFKVTKLGMNEVRILLPYRRSNLNHLKGLHACALATASEMATGIMLISRLGMGKFRLILKKLEVDYFYQGKMHAEAIFSLNEDQLQETIIQPLITEPSVLVSLQVCIYDLAGNKLTQANVEWQIKNWESTKTPM